MVDEDIKVMKIVASLLSQTLRIAEMIREENSKLVQENKELHAELEERFNPENLISNSSAMAKTLAMVKRVAGTDASVLLRGESGTGKTLLARSIHYTSNRQKAPFVIVNCAALPAGLIESELFGHEKGAFTGALNQRIGRFEAADGGTIFLDEIGEIPIETQAKLLSVIQDGTFERVGSSKTMTADVRLICATNANLEQLVRDKEFREDLYYRLMVVPINVPPLRSRREDVLPLASYFLKKFTTKYNKRISISREVMEFLEGYPWPGNVRELENTIERTVVLAGGEALTAKDIPILNSMVEAPEPVAGSRGHQRRGDLFAPQPPLQGAPALRTGALAREGHPRGHAQCRRHPDPRGAHAGGFPAAVALRAQPVRDQGHGIQVLRP